MDYSKKNSLSFKKNIVKTDIIKLNMLGIPVIQNIEGFSELIHVSKGTIYQLSKNSGKYYKKYNIPKKSGGTRTISQPSKNLKGLQGWILVNILNRLKVSNSCKGFEKKTSTVDNVQPHANNNCILTIDLENFFENITSTQVYNVFKLIGYNQVVCTILTNICTVDGHLPQGGPCSPKLANLVTWQLDVRIQGYVGRRGITFTRYADDLTFSGLNPAKVMKVLPVIEKIINDEGFKLNKRKTRIAGTSRARVVTGLTISDGSFGIGKRKYKELRAKIHYLTSSTRGNIELLKEVSGWLSYLNGVDIKRFKVAKNYIKKLQKQYPKTLIEDLHL